VEGGKGGWWLKVVELFFFFFWAGGLVSGWELLFSGCGGVVVGWFWGWVGWVELWVRSLEAPL